MKNLFGRIVWVGCLVSAHVRIGLLLAGAAFTSVVLAENEQLAFCRAFPEFTMNDGIGTTLGKLQKGGPFTVVYFGGSITEGTSYRPVFTDYLRKTYPRAQIREINAGIGGTGSNLGVYRVARDVLPYKPDLVFVEFALNDTDTLSVDPRYVAPCVESIVRQIWLQNPETDIVFLYTISHQLYLQDFQRGVLTREAAIYEALASIYRIPTVNFASRVSALANAGKLVWTLGLAPTAVPKEDPNYNAKVAAEMHAQGKIVFSNDAVHPRAEGGLLYMASLTNFFAQTMPQPHIGERTNLLARVPAAPCAYETPISVELQPTYLSGSWHRVTSNETDLARFLARTDSMWVTDTPGDRLSISFDGRELALYALYGPSGARLKVTIDGVQQRPCDLCDIYSSYWRLMRVPIFLGEKGRHQVEIEVMREQPDREQVRAFRELTPEQMKKIGFDGHRAAIGRLFIDGQLLTEE